MRKRLSIDKINKLPKAPGVYFLKNRHGDVFYIGKSNNIKNRVSTHVLDGKWQIKSVEYLKTANEIEALIREAEYIKKYQPKLNTRLRDDKQYFYVGITKEELPRVFVTHQPSSLKSKTYDLKPEFIGPFTDGAALKTTMRYLRKLFPYYSANPKRPHSAFNHRALLCSYCHIGLCPGATPDKKLYRRNITAIKQILSGKRNSAVKNLKKEMKSAAYSQYFEEAARIRDTLLSLENIFSHHNIVIPWSMENTGQAQINIPLQYIAKLIHADRDIKSIEGYDISNIQGKEPTASMVRFDNGKPNKSLYRKFNIQAPPSPNDTLMMSEVIRRRFSHREWPYPDLILIDGGRGQLNAARYELKKLGLNIQVVSLAKRLEELYFPFRKTPILIREMPSEVQNLLKHIRDEAHRFAISHHRRRHRKIFEK